MSDLSTVAGLLENAATGSGLVSVLAGGCEEVRVAELWRRSERAAAWFLETVGRDGAVGLLMETSLDCLVSLLGAWRAGVTTASCTGEASWLSRPSCGSEGGRDARARAGWHLRPGVRPAAATEPAPAQLALRPEAHRAGVATATRDFHPIRTMRPSRSPGEPQGS